MDLGLVVSYVAVVAGMLVCAAGLAFMGARDLREVDRWVSRPDPGPGGPSSADGWPGAPTGVQGWRPLGGARRWRRRPVDAPRSPADDLSAGTDPW